MNLIHFQGLNCYFNCVVSIAAYLGVAFADSFATLWSETDFSYNPRFNAYSTKRMLTNLETMGAKLSALHFVSKLEAEKAWSQLPREAIIIIGMDAFYIPWSPIYQALHDPHYFFSQPGLSDSLVCFDPTYNQKYTQISYDTIMEHVFEIFYVEKSPNNCLSPKVTPEAEAVIAHHPQTREKLLREIRECTGEKQKNAARLGKYVETLINNRYLYKYYLQHSPSDPDLYQPFFSQDFFMQWQAVKNGLYKASLMKNNQSVIYEVGQLFQHLIEEEIAMARQIITLG